MCIQIALDRVRGVDLFILFLDITFDSMLGLFKKYSIEISNLIKVLILPETSVNMSMRVNCL